MARTTGAGPPARRPARAQLQAAYGVAVPDLVGPGLRVLLVGINPSLAAGATGFHFAGAGNRLWRTLHEAGFTPRRLDAADTDALLTAGIGVTNVVNRATARAAEVTPTELRAGVARLEALAQTWRPAWVAFLGLSAYRTAFGRPAAVVGPQPDRLGPSRVWLLPNPSGLNANYQQPALTAAYCELYDAAYESRGGTD
jgi:TDG/mug DNA glycosylase family protein